jgi:hypothetical protein
VGGRRHGEEDNDGCRGELWVEEGGFGDGKFASAEQGRCGVVDVLRRG